MKKSRQQMRAEERKRIKNIISENKAFKEKFEKQELNLKTTKAVLENEIIGLKNEVERLRKENKELSKGYQKQEASEREKQFIESFKETANKINLGLCVVCKSETAVINGRCTTCHYDCP